MGTGRFLSNTLTSSSVPNLPGSFQQKGKAEFGFNGFIRKAAWSRRVPGPGFPSGSLQLKRILRMEPTVLFWLPQSEKLL